MAETPKIIEPSVARWIQAAAPGGRLVSDSRRVRHGDVFFAYPGEAADGRRFIRSAIENGAAAVVYDDREFVWDSALDVPHLAAQDLTVRTDATVTGFRLAKAP